MAYYMNECKLIGNLVADPEIRDAGSSKVCKFRIAVNNPHNETALYFYVDVWGKEGEKCMLLKKGSQVFIVNGAVIPKQYKKTLSSGEEITCTNVTINVDGYCGKVQFGPKVDQEAQKTEVKKRKPSHKKKNPPQEDIHEEDSGDSFEEGFEF